MDPGPPHKRRRPAIACTECRRRKTSCDLGTPCGQCRKSRSNLRCVYNNNNNNSSSSSGNGNSNSNSNGHKNNNSSSNNNNNSNRNNSNRNNSNRKNSSNSSNNNDNSNRQGDSSNATNIDSNSSNSSSSDSAGHSKSADDHPEYMDGRTRGWLDKDDGRTRGDGGGFGGMRSRTNTSESEVVRSSVSGEADDAPRSPHMPSTAMFSDFGSQGEFGCSDMLDLSCITGSMCFDMETTHALLPTDEAQDYIWDAGNRVGFPAVFATYSRPRCDPTTCDLERYLRLPIASSPPPPLRMPVEATPPAPWSNVSVGGDGVLLLLSRYAVAGGGGGGGSDRGEGSETAAAAASSAVVGAAVIAASSASSTSTSSTSASISGWPLVEEALGNLEHAARAAQEARPADAALGPWPDPTTVCLTVATAQRLLPPRPQCDVFVQAYIATFESLLRILDVPWFLQQYARFWEPVAAQPSSDGQISICHILLVVTLGSCVALSPLATAESQSALQQETAARISLARHWLARQMVSGYRASLGVAQSMCLLALTGVVQAQPSRTLTGADFILGDYDLTRIGLRMGLHYEPTKRNPGMSAKEVDMRRGLWTTMLELSLQHCFEKGLPAPLIPESYDCEPPSGVAGDREEDEQEALWPGLSQVLGSPIPRMLAKTQRLRLQILSLINAPQPPEKASEKGLQLAAELNQACEANLAALHQGATPTPLEEYSIHMMELFTRPFVLALHSLFVGHDPASRPMNHYARMTRMELSAQLLGRPPLGPKPVLHDGNDGESLPSSSSSSFDVAAKARTSRPDAGKDTTPDAYTSMLLYGHGPYASSKRQVVATLFLDLITELEENLFPTMLGPMRQPLRDQLSDVVRIFERRVIGGAGTHSTHEFVLFSAAAAYVDSLLQRGARVANHLVPDVDVDEAVSSAAARALTLCAEVVTRKNPELALGL